MSDVSAGPGWWQASDGQWYPPERHPQYRRPAAPPPPPPHTAPPAGTTAVGTGFGPDPGWTLDPTAAPVPGRRSLEEKGFFGSLYDFSFSSLITLRVIRFLYVLITIVYSLAALGLFVSLLVTHTPLGIVIAVVGVPLAYLLYLTVARISLEFLIVIFTIGKDVRSIREQGATARR